MRLSHWNYVVAATLVSTLGLFASHVAGAENDPSEAEHLRQLPFLGLRVVDRRPDLAKKLPDNFQIGQGLLVAAIMPGSPAEKAGIKLHDTLMSYDDQKLFAARQLVGLVRNDKTGRQVDLTILRGNNQQKIMVTLGGLEPKSAEPGSGTGLGPTPPQSAAAPAPPTGPSDKALNGKAQPEETFDSMTLKSLGKDHFQVQIQYLDKNGRLEKHAFKGTLKELRQAIQAEKDLPSQERAQLMRSLNLSEVDENF